MARVARAWKISDNVVEGGLIGYGPNRFDVGHQKGIYAGRILSCAGGRALRHSRRTDLGNPGGLHESVGSQV
jgi:hypothetical protein